MAGVRGSMSARNVCFALLTASYLLVAPNVAHADVDASAHSDRRAGFLPSLRLTSGIAMHGPRGFTPVSRLSYALGGVVGQRFVLGADLGVTTWWDAGKASFHGDTFGQLFIIRGLFARAATGVESHTYVAGVRRAAVGGSLGAGWEFPFGKKAFASLEADYDARLRTDRTLVRTVLFGIRIGAYIKK